MTRKLANLEQAVAETPVSQIPALIGVLAELQARAQLKMLSEKEVIKDVLALSWTRWGPCFRGR